jgi:uncharacterized membrane protein
MSKKTRKTILILLLVSIFLCACPGVFLVISGVEGLVDVASVGPVKGQEAYVVELVLNGGLICVSIVLIFIPIILFLIWLFNRKQKNSIVLLKPTGASKDDPIPPTS